MFLCSRYILHVGHAGRQNYLLVIPMCWSFNFHSSKNKSFHGFPVQGVRISNWKYCDPAFILILKQNCPLILCKIAPEILNYFAQCRLRWASLFAILFLIHFIINSLSVHCNFTEYNCFAIHVGVRRIFIGHSL